VLEAASHRRRRAARAVLRRGRRHAAGARRLPRGAGVFRAERLVDLPGTTLQLRVDSATGAPRLIPNLSTALVLGLSIGLFALVLLLAYDVQRRAVAERALAEALAFRKAMEDSLVTGLRARDLRAASPTSTRPSARWWASAADELLGADEPPYWPPEHRDDYRQRQAVRLARGRGPERRGARGFRDRIHAP
jgi:two-component system sensor histidine kinase DctS